MATAPGVLLLSTDDDTGIDRIRDALVERGIPVHRCGATFPCDGAPRGRLPDRPR